MPRFRLPLAPDPVQALLPPPAEEIAEQAPAAELMAAVAAGSGVQVAPASVPAAAENTSAVAAKPVQAPDVGRVIGSITTETRVAAEVAKPVAVAPPAKQVSPFVLNCWWLGEELLAIDSREPGTALPVESLFGNITRALGWHQLATARDKLKWPLAENRFAVAAGADDARDTCSSWLEAAFGRKPVKSIWLMGPQAQEFCAPVPLEQATCEWQGAQVVAMPSLTELLNEPLRKRDLWLQLRKLYPEQTRR